MSNEVSLSSHNLMDARVTVQQLQDQTLHASSQNNEDGLSQEQVVPQEKISNWESSSPSGGDDSGQIYSINACVPVVASSSGYQIMNWASTDNHLNGDFTQQLNEQRTMHWHDVEEVYYVDIEEDEMEHTYILMLDAIATGWQSPTPATEQEDND